jgi:hypothetical protein
MFFMLIISDFLLHAEEVKPVVAVLEFERGGVERIDMLLLVDMMGVNLLETDRCHVIGRLEQKKLLSGFEYAHAGGLSGKEYREAGERLFADFIITGYVDNNGRKVEFGVELFDVTFSRFLKTETYTLSSFEELISRVRPISQTLLDTIVSTHHAIKPGVRVFESLSPVPIKERILFVLQKGVLNPGDAELRKLANCVLYEMLSSRRFLPYLTEIIYVDGTIDKEETAIFLSESNCHYAAAVVRENSGYSFIVYDNDMIQRHAVVIDPVFDPVREAKRIARSIEEELPLLPQEILASEIKKNIMVEEKLDGLLFSEKLLAHRWEVTVYQRLLKPVLFYYYAPMLSVLSLEADLYWHYTPTIGLGVGYGYSFNYPGTFDRLMNTLPYIHQHEVRFIPLSFRTGGTLGFLINIIAAINLHNSYYIENHEVNGESYLTYSDETMICFAKLGLNIGMIFNLSHSFALYWNGLFLNYAIPIGEHFNYDDTDREMNVRPFSLDVAGLGIIYRF